MAKKTLKFEEAMSALEQIVRQLESEMFHLMKH